MVIKDIHSYFMNEAIKLAKKAFEEDEVPIGAVIVADNKIIAKAHNSVEKLGDVTAHAEILAITSAAQYLGSKYLNNCSIYVTVEPCLMCAFAISLARISTIVYGADCEKFGFKQYGKQIFNAKIDILSGINKNECEELMKKFFSEKRKFLY